MDRLFAQCTDLIALAGPEGLSLNKAASSALGSPPRPALLRWLHSQFSLRPHLFSVSSSTPNAAIVIAILPLRQRALGYSALEHAPLAERSWRVLELIGSRGADGLLQCELAPMAQLSPVMVQHYIGTLTARRLVARRKVVLTNSRKPAVRSAQQTALAKSSGSSVTYTAVIVLARFAATISTSTAARPTANSTDPSAVGPALDGSVIDVTLKTRIDRVLSALRSAPPYIRSQRDLKVIATPDSEKQYVAPELFLQRRHRSFRAVRTKLLRTGLVSVCQRECIGEDGKPRGMLSCLKLNQSIDGQYADGDTGQPILAGAEGEANSPSLDNRERLMEADTFKSYRPANSSITGVPHYIAEVDLTEQIFRIIKNAGPRGISVPEICSHLDNGSEMTSVVAKRVRNIATGLSRFVPTKEEQFFEGSAMHLRISFPDSSNMPSGPVTRVNKDSSEGCGGSQRKRRSEEAARRRSQLSSLAMQRRGIISELLGERKALIYETLGREVAQREQSGLNRVDQKVMRRIVNDLVASQEAKIICTTRPSMEESTRDQVVKILALPAVVEQGEEVRSLVASLVTRSVLGGGSEKLKSGYPLKRSLMDTNFSNDNEGHDRKLEKAPKTKTKRHKSTSTPRKKKVPKTVEKPEHELRDASIGSEVNGDGSSPQTEQFSNPIDLDDGTNPIEAVEGAKCAKVNKHVETDEFAVKEDQVPRSDVQKEAAPVPLSVINPSDSEKDSVPKLLVQTKLRNMKKSRLMRLRALDYGWMKGKLARLRMLHEKLFQTAHGVSKNDEEEAEHLLVHSTVEAGKATAPIGNFTIYSCVRNLTVAEYAAIIGIYQALPVPFESIQDSLVADVIDIVREEVMSLQASRVIRSLIAVLMRLGLMESSADSSWILSGAGIIRDFGRGIPLGVVPHSVIFSSMSAVKVYWKELERFAKMKFEKGGDQKNETLSPQEAILDGNYLPVIDVYIQMRWKDRLHHGFMKSEQQQYEAVLQRLCGVDVTAETLTGRNLLMGPLKRFAIEELYDAVHDSTGKDPDRCLFEKSTFTMERLLAYSRFRTKNVIPKGICRDLSTSNGQLPIRTVDAAENASVLHVHQENVATRKPSTKASNNSRVARISKPPVKKKLDRQQHESKQVGPAKHDIHLELEWCVCLLSHVVQGRALAYCQNSLELLEWRNATSLIYMDPPKDILTKSMTAEKRSARKTVAALCDCTLIRATVDILAVKLAMCTWRVRDDYLSKLQLLETRTVFPIIPPCLQQLSPNVYDILRAAIIEMTPRLNQDERFTVQFVVPDNLSLHSLRYRTMTLGLELSRMRIDENLTLSHRVSILASRYRRMLEASIRGVTYHGILPCKPEEYVQIPAHQDQQGQRTEVLEQVILSVLREDLLVQVSEEVRTFIRRFNEVALCEARNRLLLKGIISFHEDKAMHYFEVLSREKTGEAIQFVRRSQCEREEHVRSVMSTSEGEADEIDWKNFGRSKLWKDICSNKTPESGNALEVAAELLFFSKRKRRLSLMPIVRSSAAEGNLQQSVAKQGQENAFNEKGVMREQEERHDQEIVDIQESVSCGQKRKRSEVDGENTEDEMIVVHYAIEDNTLWKRQEIKMISDTSRTDKCVSDSEFETWVGKMQEKQMRMLELVRKGRTGYSGEDAKEVDALAIVIAEYVVSVGGGCLARELLERIERDGVGRVTILRAVRVLMRLGLIVRMIVDEDNWDAMSGICYIAIGAACRFCRRVEGGWQMVSAFMRGSDEMGDRVVHKVATAIVECVIRWPGITEQVLVEKVKGRVGEIVGRGIVDVAHVLWQQKVLMKQLVGAVVEDEYIDACAIAMGAKDAATVCYTANSCVAWQAKASHVFQATESLL